MWLAVLVVMVGGLSSFYAARFHLLTYGPGEGGSEGKAERGLWVEVVAAGVLAAITVGLSALWQPGAKDVVAQVTGGQVPEGTSWELASSLAFVGIGVYAAHAARRRQQLTGLGLSVSRQEVVADWLGLPSAVRGAVVAPVLALRAALARFDDRVVDAGVRGAALFGRAASRAVSSAGELTFDGVVEGLGRGAVGAAGSLRALDEGGVDRAVEGAATVVGVGGRDSRRLQTGLAHHYYVIVTVGLVAAVVAAAVWRS